MKESVNCGEDPKVPSVKIEFEIMAGCAVLSHSVVSDSVTPWAVALQASLSMGFSRQEYCSGLPCLPSRGSSQPRNRTRVSCIAGRFFTSWATRGALRVEYPYQKAEEVEERADLEGKACGYWAQVPKVKVWEPVRFWVFMLFIA